MNRRQIFSAVALVLTLVSGPLQAFAGGPAAAARTGVRVIEVITGSTKSVPTLEALSVAPHLSGARGGAAATLEALSGVGRGSNALSYLGETLGESSQAEDPWTSLVKKYCLDDGQSASALRRMILNRSGRSNAAEDMAQDVLLNIFQQCDKIRSGAIAEPGRYVQTTISNRTRDLYRHSKSAALPMLPPHFDMLNSERDPALSPEDQVIYRQLLQMANLTPRQSEAFTLYIEGYTRSEIAERLQISEGRVKELIKEAKTRVRENL